MIQVVLNEQGFVKAYALVGRFAADSVEVNEPSDVADFEEHYRSYYLSEDGMLVKSEDKQSELEEECVLHELRQKREKLCFSYINRGEFWYSRLSDVQKTELNAWYQAWLDVTETKAIPVMPEWLI